MTPEAQLVALDPGPVAGWPAGSPQEEVEEVAVVILHHLLPPTPENESRVRAESCGQRIQESTCRVPGVVARSASTSGPRPPRSTLAAVTMWRATWVRGMRGAGPQS